MEAGAKREDPMVFPSTHDYGPSIRLAMIPREFGPSVLNAPRGFRRGIHQQGSYTLQLV
jgi:hypothetical protein